MTADRVLRLSLAVVYLWFGALKLIGLSPALGLVRSFSPWMATVPLYIALALFEIGLGVALGLAVWRRWTPWAVILHLIGTFGVLVSSPATAFLPSFPFLTLEGEFVIKNLVLLAAAITLLLYQNGRPQARSAGRIRSWVLASVLMIAVPVGFAAARLHELLRSAAEVSTRTSAGSMRLNAAQIMELTDNQEEITVSGTVVDRCPILGCWMKLGDSSGTVFIDLAPRHLSVRSIPIGTHVVVRGSISNTREGGAGFVASSINIVGQGVSL